MRTRLLVCLLSSFLIFSVNGVGQKKKHKAPKNPVKTAQKQEALEERHQGADFLLRTFPILRREGVKREELDAEFLAAFDGFADRLGAGAVSGLAREAPIIGGMSSFICRQR